MLPTCSAPGMASAIKHVALLASVLLLYILYATAALYLLYTPPRVTCAWSQHPRLSAPVSAADPSALHVLTDAQELCAGAGRAHCKAVTCDNLQCAKGKPCCSMHRSMCLVEPVAGDNTKTSYLPGVSCYKALGGAAPPAGAVPAIDQCTSGRVPLVLCVRILHGRQYIMY